MTDRKPSKEFPKGAFADNVANAVVRIICENVPSLRGPNHEADIVEHAAARVEDNFGKLSDASVLAAAFMAGRAMDRAQKCNLGSRAIMDFRILLSVRISQAIRERGGFNFLEFYISGTETYPEWLGQMIDAVAQETGVDLCSLMPYREKLAITVHQDGEIFWGVSGYGPAKPITRLENYVGKPEALPFVDISQMQPDTAQAYVLDLGQYVPIIVPDDRSQERDSYNFFCEYELRTILEEIADKQGRIKRNEERLAEGGTINTLSYENDIQERDFLQSLLAMWQEHRLEGYPYPCIAFVPADLIRGLSEEDFRDIDVLRRLRDAEGTIMHTLRGWECPVMFTSTHQYNGWDTALLGQPLQRGCFPFMDSDFGRSLKGYGGIDTVFRREGDRFRLITDPFYLWRVPMAIQTGIGGNNTHLNPGEILLFTKSGGFPIGEYRADIAAICRLPEAALSRLLVEGAVDKPFNNGGLVGENSGPHTPTIR